MGLRPPLPQRTRSSIGSAGVATHLQSPPATLSDRPRAPPPTPSAPPPPRHYPNELARRSALPAWLHIYSHHRQHSAIGQGPTHHVIDRPAWAVHLALLLLIFASNNQRPRPGLVSGPTPAPDCRSPE